jgi:hypothetical protein
MGDNHGVTPGILSRLTSIKITTAGWQACCPAHEDKKASLSVAVGKDGKTVLHCQAGCSAESVLSALSLTMSDLFPPKEDKPRSRIVATYDYLDASGKLLFQAVRFDPKSFRQRRPDPDQADKWIWNLKDVDLVLYRLPELLASQGMVVVCEGEKDVDNLRALGFTATCNPMGAGKWRSWFSNTLNGRDVVIVADKDNAGKKFAGQKHAAQVRDNLHGKAASVVVLELPGDGVKDASDWITQGGTREAFLELVRTAPEWKEPEENSAGQAEESPADPAGQAPEAPESSDPEPGPKQSPKKKVLPTEVERLMSLALEQIDLFRTAVGAHATVPTTSGRQNLLIQSPSFRWWLMALNQATFSKSLSDTNARRISDAIAAQAEFGPKQARMENLFVRVGHLDTPEGLKIYLDLCDDAWRCIEITADGWRIIQDPPVKFRRSKSMLPLPEPVTGGSLNELRPLINCHQDESWILTLAWLVGSLHPKGPYPVLILQGEQGTAKSTMSRLLRGIIDPNLAPIRCIPKEDEDILIAAHNSWVICFDNLSGIPDRLSDIFCRLATGGGFSKRELYTNNEESITEATRPQILNGIDDVAHRGDLRNRALILNLDPIPDTARREERVIMAEFEAARPRILGALLSAVSVALKNHKPEAGPPEGVPRMADFANWVIAAEAGLEMPKDTFIQTYRISAAHAVENAIESSPLAKAIQEFAEDKKYWGGMVSDLLEELNKIAPETAKKRRDWPADSTRLSGKIRRILPDLRTLGINIDFTRQKRGVRAVVTFDQDGGEKGVAENLATPSCTTHETGIKAGDRSKGVAGVADFSLYTEKEEKEEGKRDGEGAKKDGEEEKGKEGENSYTNYTKPSEAGQEQESGGVLLGVSRNQLHHPGEIISDQEGRI